MRIKLDERLVQRLAACPESGMGYQRVVLTLADGSELKNVLVFNAEEAEVPEMAARIGIRDVRLTE